MTRKVIEKLAELNASDIMVIVGGVIPEEDIPKLKEMGVAGVFTAGSSIGEIAEFIRSHVRNQGPGSQSVA
jgi:methylmalonyl-CoA mutase C-terminal domain/subunit